MLQVNLACCTIPGHSSLPDLSVQGVALLGGALSEGGKHRNVENRTRTIMETGLSETDRADPGTPMRGPAESRNGVWRGERVGFSSKDHGPALRCTAGTGIGDGPCLVV